MILYGTASGSRAIAYRWDDLPESVRARIRQRIANAEQQMRKGLMRKSPKQLARMIYPEVDQPLTR